MQRYARRVALHRFTYLACSFLVPEWREAIAAYHDFGDAEDSGLATVVVRLGNWQSCSFRAFGYECMGTQ